MSSKKVIALEELAALVCRLTAKIPLGLDSQ
jgi:hypothetical protein